MDRYKETKTSESQYAGARVHKLCVGVWFFSHLLIGAFKCMCLCVLVYVGPDRKRLLCAPDCKTLTVGVCECV